MSELEQLVRRRMEEEYAKGTSAERISAIVADLFNSYDTTRDVKTNGMAGHRRP